MNSFVYLVYFFLFITFVPNYVKCFNISANDCAPFDCGKFKDLHYPFRKIGEPNFCGHPGFSLDCQSDDVQILFEEMSQRFRILDINPKGRTLKIARMDISDSICPEKFSNTSLNSSIFNYTEKDKMAALLYECDEGDFPFFISFPCTVNNISTSSYFVMETELDSPIFPSCNVSVMVPVMEKSFKTGFMSQKLKVDDVMEEGFEVGWSSMGEDKCEDCILSSGKCGFDFSVNEFRCFCPDDNAYALSCPSNTISIPQQPPPPPPQLVVPTIDNIEPIEPAPSETAGNSPRKRDWLLKGGIAVGAIFAGIILMGFVVFCYQRRNKKTNAPPYFLSRSISSNISSVKDIEKGSTYFGVHLFSYEELVEATNNFDSSKELGDGGFGTVYYGKLHDGREVAVKRLYESNCRRVEQFMNEVTILASLRHPNLVSLFGCTSRHSHGLLLVYEYIQNGTVADHLHGQRAKPGALAWPMRLKIAIETACALAYLHASDIVHRDVKTTNILLDSSFSVKVADFGLSRLFPTHVTHVSTAPQGTPGYVDPEYHQCYQLTSKSDVYSFGVVLMELVSSMPAVDIARHRHDINLSTMAINRIQNHTLHEIVDPCLKFDTDIRVKQTITGVAELAFQCLQNEKDLRPSMVDVLEELKAIQSRGYKTKNAKNDSTEDDVGLLKCGPLTLSPDTVTISWSSSRNTTPNASG
uniref:non-specific serine/threonine protein kinase n=1 Tax=Cannabis sativa TaxID=3483 RepID=A0A803R0J4_CANSA